MLLWNILEKLRDQDLDNIEDVETLNQWINAIDKMKDVILLDRKEYYVSVIINLEICFSNLNEIEVT